jgi:hypothetical protein
VFLQEGLKNQQIRLDDGGLNTIVMNFFKAKVTLFLLKIKVFPHRFDIFLRRNKRQEIFAEALFFY